MRHFISTAFLIFGLGLSNVSYAKIDLVTLPDRDKIQLTIYNSADLTLVREQRTLTLKKGLNRLEFGWENTLIDPTSVRLRAPRHAAQVRLLEVSYPRGVKGSAIWTIESDIAGPVPVEITFFTSGISWHAFYMGTLSEDEQHLQLQGYVTIRNYSGEDYENASTRVIVGKIHLLDEIAELARRDTPYNRPDGTAGRLPMTLAVGAMKKRAYMEMDMAEEKMSMNDAVTAKSIVKEGLSEYFLYSIEGTENIPNQWGKRLPSFNIKDIPIRNLYRFEAERYGNAAHRLVYFRNDKKHQLGKEPLPDGKIKVFREIDDKKSLAYTGQVHTKYIPVNQEIELDFGAAREVKVEPVLMSEQTENYMFNNKGNISGFDRIQEWEIKIENNRDIPISVEVLRNFNNSYWDIDNSRNNKGEFDKIDIDSVKYTIELPPQSKSTLAYTLTQYEGERQNRR
ncbi:MAG: DUF4139 domain-containing protein [Gammaproteobacteria bacterium]